MHFKYVVKVHLRTKKNLQNWLALISVASTSLVFIMFDNCIPCEKFSSTL